MKYLIIKLGITVLNQFKPNSKLAVGSDMIAFMDELRDRMDTYTMKSQRNF